MSITESRLKQGALVLDVGGEGMAKFATQATNVVISPSTKQDGEPLEVLDGNKTTAASTTEWTLKAKAIQDFTDPAGLQAYSWEHDGETVPFTWTPTQGGPVFSGNVTIQPLDVGGDVNKRIDVDVEWPLTGKPDWSSSTP